MVDFNTETAINTPAKSIEAVLILEKRESFLQAKESYSTLKFQGSNPNNAVMRARLLNLIDQWEGFLRRQEQLNIIDWILKLESDDCEYEDIKNIYYELSKLMDISNLTKIDSVQIDRTNIELENEFVGLD